MKKILFVEDDAVVTRIYIRKLEDEGFKVLAAEDGLVAMKLLMTYQPDLVVLDILMPKLNGLDVLKFIRTHPELKTVPVVLFSSALLTDLGEQVAALGIHGSLLKSSATPDALAEMIAQIFKPAAPVAGPPAPRLSAYTAAKAAATGAPEPEPELPPAKKVKPVPAAGVRMQVERHFLTQRPVIAESLDKLVRDFLKADTPMGKFQKVEALRRKLGFVTHMAGMAGCYRIAQLSGSLESLLFKLQEDATGINDSSRNTVAGTVGFLCECFDRAEVVDEQCLSPTPVLIVDDDAVSNLALTYALRKANANATTVLDPFTALKKLKQTFFD